MKTLKSITEESRKFYTENPGVYFSKSFNKKMGGTQTITFEDDFLPSIELDKREYYTGRGAKYNSNSMHEHIDVFVTKSEFEEKVNHRAKSIFDKLKAEKEMKKNVVAFCKENNLNAKNYSSIYDGFIHFDFENRKAVELELNVDLTAFFDSGYKTYFFAESKIGLVRFYHNHHQSYGFEKVTEEQKDKFHNDWHSVPYDCPNIGNLYYC